MNVLTYNICWQAMSGIAAGSTPILGRKCIKYANGTTLCMNNLISFIDNSPSHYDIVGLQESNAHPLIIKNSITLNEMNHISHKSGEEEMITFYNQESLKLRAIYTGEFELGRPFQLLAFERQHSPLLVIHVHYNHSHDLEALERHLSIAIDNLHNSRTRKPMSLTTIKKFLEAGDNPPLIIALGDFNIKTSSKNFRITPFRYANKLLDIVRNIEVSNANNVRSCCSNKHADIYSFQRTSDFILSSSDIPPSNRIPKHYDRLRLISDHLPIEATNIN